MITDLIRERSSGNCGIKSHVTWKPYFVTSWDFELRHDVEDIPVYACMWSEADLNCS